MNKIKYFRQKLGLTVKELSDKSNVATGYISDLENDKSGIRNPSRSVMFRISEVLGQSIPDIFFPEQK